MIRGVLSIEEEVLDGYTYTNVELNIKKSGVVSRIIVRIIDDNNLEEILDYKTREVIHSWNSTK